MNMNSRERRELAFSKLFLIVLAVIGLGLVVYFAWIRPGGQPQSVNSFAECRDAGYPIQESYPEVCVTEKGERFVNPDQKVQTTPQPETSQSTDATQQITANDGYLVIDEWAVRLPLTADNSDIVYRYVKDDSFEGVYFTYERLREVGVCKEDAGVALSRKLTENQPPYSVGNQQSFKKVGNYFYYRGYGNAPCYDPESQSQAKLVNQINGGDLKGGITKALDGLQAAE